MKRPIKFIILGIVLGGLTFLYSCGDEKKTTDPDPVPAKTLKKELLYDKTWYEPITGHKHKFLADGTYKGPGGTWKWLNNSDSMEIKETEFTPAYIWYFKYCTDHEMACALGWDEAARNDWDIYKDTQ